MSTTLLYFIVMMDNISDTMIGLFTAAAIIIGAAGTIWIIVYFVKSESTYNHSEELKRFLVVSKRFKKAVIICGFIFVVSGLLAIFTPNTNQMAVIYVIPKALHNKQLKKLPNKLLRLSNEWLDNEIEKYKETQN